VRKVIVFEGHLALYSLVSQLKKHKKIKI